MDREKNFRQRIEWIRYWAGYMRTHSNSEWSGQQKRMIDSVLQTANKDRMLYLKVKEKSRNAG